MIYQLPQIFSPVDSQEEVLPLIKAGADEFYCGVNIDNENAASIRNPRISEAMARISNLPDLGALSQLTSVIKKNKKKVYVALNLPNLSVRHKKIIKKHIKDIKKTGVDGVILTSPELIGAFRNSGLEIVASSFLEVKNQEAIKMLAEMGVRRIIFSRQISLADLKTVSDFPELKFEVFMMSSACRSMANYCFPKGFWSHDNLWKNKECRHLCWGNYEIMADKKSRRLTPALRKLIANRLRLIDSSGTIPACGACAIFYFQKYKIDFLKIVGRNFSTDRKIKYVEFIKASLEILRKNVSQEKFYQNTQKLFKKTFGKSCHRRYCYYPHFFD